ncbi:MAG: hypothetical protein MK066_10935 [Crocinitomicaceae bacterium]|nr:hypothetical protein [Crocinitomicaceae bacterium]
MKNRIAHLLSVFSLILISVSCSDTNNEENVNLPEINTETSEEMKMAEEFESYIAMLDFNDSLGIANSLFYTKGENESVEVVLFFNDSSELVKVVEKMTLPQSSSVQSNVFYLKEGKKYATKEYMEKVEGDSSYFVELRSYYDSNEKPIVTKKRSAMFEEMLEMESFQTIEPQDCSMDRALRCVNQEEEFATTFQGFVELENGFLFLIVGEDSKEGYSSAMIVQQVTPTIMELRSKEIEMLGTPLIVDFRTVVDQGTQQILLSVRKG